MGETLDGKPRREVQVPTNMEGGLPICPHCGCNRSEVVNTYPWAKGKKRRRRECDHCGLTFHTVQDSEEVE